MYDRLAQFYEWEHHGFQGDLPLYLGFAKAAQGAILDAACGTGRLTLPLAEAGYVVTGVDSSAEMLAIARSRVANSPGGPRVQLEQADLRSIELGRLFGMAMVALSSFQHLLTTGDQRRALGRLAAHLAAGGLLVVDLVNPSPEWLAAGDGALVHQRTAPFPDPEGSEQLSKFVARTSYFDTQREQLLLVYDLVGAEGTMRRLSLEMELRFLFRYEAELLLEDAGFRLRGIYGDYDLEDYQTSSPRMILVAEKR